MPSSEVHLRHLDGDDVDALMPALVELLAANVADGASVGFHPPLADAEAEGYWRGVQAGRLPGYVREADGTTRATLFFYRELDAPRGAPGS